MKQQFLDIQLKKSNQEASQISLGNMVEMLQEPDFRQKIQNCKNDYESIEQFPLAGFAILIKKYKKKLETKIKVIEFSDTLKFIDTNALQFQNAQMAKIKSNCVLPLLSIKEGNDQLLNCELFNRKVSYLVHGKLDCYKEDSYLLLIQASINYLIKQKYVYSWGSEILDLAFQTCQQVFINTPLFCQSLSNEKFLKSKFQLLNLYCLFQMKQLSTEELLEYYIQNNFKDFDELDEEKLQSFFNTLKFEQVNQIFQNIREFMDHYLIDNNYFILKLTQKKIVQKLVEYMIPKEVQWENLQKLEFIQNKSLHLKILKYYTISTIYQKLFHNLIHNYDEVKKVQYFTAFSQHFEENDDELQYQEFLMKHEEYYEIYHVFTLYSQTINEFQSDQSSILEMYQIITIRFIVNNISIDSIKRLELEGVQDLMEVKEFQKANQYLETFQTLFNLKSEDSYKIHALILDEIKNVTWLNYLSSITDFKNNESIERFLKGFIKHLTKWRSKQEQDFFAQNLTEFSKFSFLLLQRTRMLNQITILDQAQLQKIMTKKKEKEQYCKNIYNISKCLKL